MTRTKNLFSSFQEAFSLYFTFRGRATRYDYWSFIFANFLVSLGLSMIDVVAGLSNVLGTAYSIIILIPSFTIQVRRLHDVNRTGFTLVMPLVFLVFAILAFAIIPPVGILLGLVSLIAYLRIWYLTMKKGDSEDNMFGAPVKEDEKYDNTAKTLIFVCVILPCLLVIGLGMAAM